MPRPIAPIALMLMICGIAVLLSSDFALSQALPAQESGAVVSVITSQAGLPVFVNGVKVGVTPLKFMSLPAGDHEIAVRLNQSDSWLDADWVEKYRLATGDTLDIHPEFKRGYVINSKPFGAEVFLEKIYYGTTPVVVYTSGSTPREVELRLNGYESFVLSIDGTAQRLWNITLREDRDQQQIQEAGLRNKNSRRSHFRRLAMIAGGVSAASGVTAILLKRRADDFYDDYLSTGNPLELEVAYSKTGQYDEYAGTAFIVFQVSFGLSFYWFLRSTAE